MKKEKRKKKKKKKNVCCKAKSHVRNSSDSRDMVSDFHFCQEEKISSEPQLHVGQWLFKVRGQRLEWIDKLEIDDHRKAEGTKGKKLL